MAVFCLLSYVTGTCMGSFVYCVTERILNHKFINGRSCCDSCQHVLHWYDLLPVVSWCALKGKCRYCGGKISVMCVIAEQLMGIVYGLVGYLYGFSAFTVLLWGVTAAVLSLSIEDIRQYTIHDGYHVLLVLMRVIYAVSTNEEEFLYYLPGALLVTCFVFFLAQVMHRVMHKVCLGMGDVKLTGCIALYTGAEGTWMVFALASFAALVMAVIMKRNKVPFGPFLGGAMLVVLTACGGMVYCIH